MVVVVVVVVVVGVVELQKKTNKYQQKVRQNKIIRLKAGR